LRRLGGVALLIPTAHRNFAVSIYNPKQHNQPFFNSRDMITLGRQPLAMLPTYHHQQQYPYAVRSALVYHSAQSHSVKCSNSLHSSNVLVVVKHHMPLAGMLGLVHRDVGMAQQVTGSVLLIAAR